MSKLLVPVVSHGPKASTLMLGEWVWLGTLFPYSFPIYFVVSPSPHTHPKAGRIWSPWLPCLLPISPGTSYVLLVFVGLCPFCFLLLWFYWDLGEQEKIVHLLCCFTQMSRTCFNHKSIARLSEPPMASTLVIKVLLVTLLLLNPILQVTSLWHLLPHSSLHRARRSWRHRFPDCVLSLEVHAHSNGTGL